MTALAPADLCGLATPASLASKKCTNPECIPHLSLGCLNWGHSLPKMSLICITMLPSYTYLPVLRLFI